MASRLRPPQRPICVTRPHLCEILHDFAIFWPCLRDAVRLISAASGGGMGRRGWIVLLIVAVLVLLGIGGGAALFELARLVDPVAAALSGSALVLGLVALSAAPPPLVGPRGVPGPGPR